MKSFKEFVSQLNEDISRADIKVGIDGRKYPAGRVTFTGSYAKNDTADSNTRKNDKSGDRNSTDTPIKPIKITDKKTYKDAISFKHNKLQKPSPLIVKETLAPSASVSDYIEDFVSSDDPKFDGKSKEARRMMGIAAYYASKK